LRGQRSCEDECDQQWKKLLRQPHG